jgi:hypothetical protein
MYYPNTQMTNEESDEEEETADDEQKDTTQDPPPPSPSKDDSSTSSEDKSSDSDSSSDSSESENEPAETKADENDNIDDTLTTNKTTYHQPRSNRIGHYIPVDRSKRILYELTPTFTYRHEHIHNQYFDREEHLAETPNIELELVAVTACEYVIKVHEESLETDYPNNYPIDEYHYTIDDVEEFHEAELQETRKQSNKISYEREVQRGIRHSIPEYKWDDRMSSEERLML